MRLPAAKDLIERLSGFEITEVEAGFLMGIYAGSRVMEPVERHRLFLTILSRARLPTEEFDYEKRMALLLYVGNRKRDL